MSADVILVATFAALFAVVAWWDHTARRHDRQQELDAYAAMDPMNDDRMTGAPW